MDFQCHFDFDLFSLNLRNRTHFSLSRCARGINYPFQAYSLHSGHFSDVADPKIVAHGSNASSSASSSSSAIGDAQHATLAALLEAIRLRSESILVDFEQHLQAATDDWTNEALDTELIALIAKKSAQ